MIAAPQMSGIGIGSFSIAQPQNVTNAGTEKPARDTKEDENHFKK